MAWIALIAAGICEMAGVAMINKWNNDHKWHTLVFLALGFGVSFLCLSFAMETLPMGTAYAIWTGIGAAGGAILGMVLYGESTDWKRIFFITLILSSAIGLKLIG